MAWTTCNIRPSRPKSDTVFTKNLRSNLMLSPKFDLMSYAEKKIIQLAKHVAGLSALNGELGIGSKYVVPNSSVTEVTL